MSGVKSIHDYGTPNRRIRDPYVRWCERRTSASNSSRGRLLDCQEYFIVSPLVYSKIPFGYSHQDTTQHDNTHSDI